MANVFQRAADWLRDKAFGTPTAEAQPAGPAMPAPVDYSEAARAQLLARLNQFAEQRREERRNADPATQEKPVTETVSEAKHELHKAKAAQQEHAAQFWQNAVDQGRIMRQETEQVQQKEKEPAFTAEPAPQVP
jgi:hypothetical protein